MAHSHSHSPRPTDDIIATMDAFPLSEETPEFLAEKQAAASRSTWVSVVVNLLLTAGQAIVGWFAGSSALMADAVHSLSDLLSDFVVLIANRHSSKEADDDHHYGHHRYENAASLVLGLLLLGVGVGMLWGAVGKIQHHEALPKVHIVALWVALVALVVKEGLFRYMLHVGEKYRSRMLIANAWHARSDAASSLVVALGIGGNLLGYPLLDPVAALIVGGMVLKMGGQFAWEALHDLMDGAVDSEQTEAIRTTLAQCDGVHGVHDLRARKMGDWVMIDAHLEVQGDLTVRQGHDIAAAARERVLKTHPHVLDVMTHVDPV